MPQLIDRLLAAEKWWIVSCGLPKDCFNADDAWYEQLIIRKDLASSVVFSIDNLAQYYFANHVREDDCDGPEAFPNLAQPYQRAFFEYRLQPQMYDALFDEADRGMPRQISHVGVLAISFSPSLVSAPEWDRAFGSAGLQRSQCQWIQSVSLFTQSAVERDFFGISYKSMLALAAEGTLLTEPCVSLWHVRDSGDIYTEDAVAAMLRLGRLINPVFLAVSLLHCKNVSTADHAPPPKLNKAYRRRHERPLLSYKTLTLLPLMPRKRGASVSASLGDPKALHLCRGHFKDYRNSRGLFGKHQGLFWWDMHARGAAEQGAVVKDYAIKLPNSGEAREHG